MRISPIQERRRRAWRWFWARVCLLVALIGAVVYSAWFAPWAKPAKSVRVEVVEDEARR